MQYGIGTFLKMKGESITWRITVSFSIIYVTICISPQLDNNLRGIGATAFRGSYMSLSYFISGKYHVQARIL